MFQHPRNKGSVNYRTLSKAKKRPPRPFTLSKPQRGVAMRRTQRGSHESPRRQPSQREAGRAPSMRVGMRDSPGTADISNSIMAC
ncbi:hypothetical protein C8T65DRAFT_47937 [Cerioporus squamosus]|nr:hypothetical protein C8T65DRAFT_47937 [Cerioporus squamosus]